MLQKSLFLLLLFISGLSGKIYYSALDTDRNHWGVVRNHLGGAYPDVEECELDPINCLDVVKQKQDKIFKNVFNFYSAMHETYVEEIEKLGILIIRPMAKALQGHKLPVIIWFHSGWIGGTHKDYLAILFSKKTNSLVICVRIRNTLDVPFEAVVHDGILGYHWALSNVELYGGDSKKISIAGHGTGSHLASLVTHKLLEINIQPNLLILIIPTVLPRGISDSNLEFLHVLAKEDFWDYFTPHLVRESILYNQFDHSPSIFPSTHVLITDQDLQVEYGMPFVQILKSHQIETNVEICKNIFNAQKSKYSFHKQDINCFEIYFQNLKGDINLIREKKENVAIKANDINFETNNVSEVLSSYFRKKNAKTAAFRNGSPEERFRRMKLKNEIKVEL